MRAELEPKSKLGGLIAEGEHIARDEWTDESWLVRALAELRRFQARERQLEELEAKWRERWSVYSERRVVDIYDTTSRDMQAELERCQDELQAAQSGRKHES